MVTENTHYVKVPSNFVTLLSAEAIRLYIYGIKMQNYVNLNRHKIMNDLKMSKFTWQKTSKELVTNKYLYKYQKRNPNGKWEWNYSFVKMEDNVKTEPQSFEYSNVDLKEYYANCVAYSITGTYSESAQIEKLFLNLCKAVNCAMFAPSILKLLYNYSTIENLNMQLQYNSPFGSDYNYTLNKLFVPVSVKAAQNNYTVWLQSALVGNKNVLLSDAELDKTNSTLNNVLKMLHNNQYNDAKFYVNNTISNAEAFKTASNLLCLYESETTLKLLTESYLSYVS